LVFKVLLSAAIASSREFLRPEQVCNSVRSGADVLVHETREFLDKHVEDDFVMVSIDAWNSFSAFSRKEVLDLAREQAPSAFRRINPALESSSPHIFLVTANSRVKTVHRKAIILLCCSSRSAFRHLRASTLSRLVSRQFWPQLQNPEKEILRRQGCEWAAPIRESGAATLPPGTRGNPCTLMQPSTAASFATAAAATVYDEPLSSTSGIVSWRSHAFNLWLQTPFQMPCLRFTEAAVRFIFLATVRFIAMEAVRFICMAAVLGFLAGLRRSSGAGSCPGVPV
jgi:hypothetical protein